jgi:pimeloyl-ACP methyl ester carboxylesterase
MADYFQLGDVRTYYEEDGEGDPRILLHPGGADSRAWESNLPGLAEMFRVYRPDRRGHGLRTRDLRLGKPPFLTPTTTDGVSAESLRRVDPGVDPRHLLACPRASGSA